MGKRLLILLITFVVAFLVVGSTFFVPISFSGIHEGISSTIWLFLSNTGGVWGVPVITIFFCLLIAYYQESWRKRMVSVGVSVVLFSMVLGGCAKVNENIVKKFIKTPRPYAGLLENAFSFDTRNFYTLEETEDRAIYLDSFLIQVGKGKIIINTEMVDQDILDHWVEETGFSFPSGHTINAFIMATLLGYMVLFIYSDGYKRRFLYVLPFIWASLVALSRVAIGAHSPLDITVGAVVGTLFSFGIISTTLIDRFINPK